MKIKTVAVVRDDLGFYTHPDILKFLEGKDESYSWNMFRDDVNIELSNVWMSDDANEEISDRYFDGETSACLEWIPSKPEGRGWVLLSINDSDDGAVATWGRNK